MRIGINASCLEGGRFGVGRWLINLLRIWAQDFPQHKYHLYFRRSIPSDKLLDRECFVKTLVKCPPILNKSPIWEQLFLSQRVSRDGHIDLFFSPSYTLPLVIIGKKRIVQIFDISYTSHPEWYPLGERWYYQLVTLPTIRKADLITTGSRFTKDEIHSHFKVEDEKVRPIYIAAESKFQPIENKEGIKKAKAKYNIKGDYLLYVGLIANRRNVPTLLESFKKLLQRTEANYSLVLIGANRTHPHFEVSQLVTSLGLGSKVIYLDYVDEDDLVLIYNGASVFIYPSLYEGFGIPPLEAMACGIPVITSNRSSLPEVVGDAAYLLNDPTSVDEMLAGIEKVLFDESLRTQMIAKGLERAKMFSWEKCARETMGVFEEVCKS